MPVVELQWMLPAASVPTYGNGLAGWPAAPRHTATTATSVRMGDIEQAIGAVVVDASSSVRRARFQMGRKEWPTM